MYILYPQLSDPESMLQCRRQSVAVEHIVQMYISLVCVLLVYVSLVELLNVNKPIKNLMKTTRNFTAIVCAMCSQQGKLCTTKQFELQLQNGSNYSPDK